MFRPTVAIIRFIFSYPPPSQRVTHTTEMTHLKVIDASQSLIHRFEKNKPDDGHFWPKHVVYTY